MEFLDFVGKKGLGGPSMVAGRKAAANALLGVLSVEETSDLRALDLDEVAKRFINLRGSEFKPESVQVYRSRLERAISDLVRYRQDPIAFKPTIPTTKRVTSSKSEKPVVKDHPKPSAEGQMSTTSVSEITFPVPIRPGVIIRIIGIPHDLSAAEAERVSNVILALASDSGRKSKSSG